MWRSKREQKRAEQIAANDERIAAFWARVEAKERRSAAIQQAEDEGLIAPAERLDAINIGCPTCNMPAPLMCRTEDGQRMDDTVHPERWDARAAELRWYRDNA